jgi:hypothetical protein
MPRPRGGTLNVAAGSPLGFVAGLKAKDSWPPAKVRRDYKDVTPATPYLVIRAGPNDAGARPLPGSEALSSSAIEFVTAAGGTVAIPKAGQEYRLRVRIHNFGAAPSYAGVAEFVVADPTVLAAAAQGGPPPPPWGIEGFIVTPDSDAVATCRRTWKPLHPPDASASVLVQAYDALLDPIARRWDARGDRHVARHDNIPDFAGAWQGPQFFAGAAGGSGFLYRVEVTQAATSVSVSIYEEVSGVAIARNGGPVGGGAIGIGLGRGLGIARRPTLPATPQLTGSGVIANRIAQLTITELLELNGPGTNPVPFTDNVITMTLPSPDTLHVTTHRTFVAPGDTRGPQDLVADLTRQ